MRTTRAKTLLVVGLAVAILLLMTGSAFAAAHVTTRSITTASVTNVSLMSTGDAGDIHGNAMNMTSPVLPSPPNYFYWYNQPVMASGFGLVDPDHDSDLLFTHGMYSINGVGATAFTGPFTAMQEGYYGLTLVGTEDDGTTTATVSPAFGIDMTAPMSHSDAVPVYAGGMATINISATDALSGVEDIRWSMDGGPWDSDVNGVAGTTMASVVFSTPGFHTLWWRTCDNAGNEDFHSVSFIVRPVNFTPIVTLNARPHGGAMENSHIVTFSGTVQAMASDTTLLVTVQRWNGKMYVPFKSFSTTIPMYTNTYSFTKIIVKDAKYRAIASDSGGLSNYKKFTVK